MEGRQPKCSSPAKPRHRASGSSERCITTEEQALQTNRRLHCGMKTWRPVKTEQPSALLRKTHRWSSWATAQASFSSVDHFTSAMPRVRHRPWRPHRLRFHFANSLNKICRSRRTIDMPSSPSLRMKAHPSSGRQGSHRLPRFGKGRLPFANAPSKLTQERQAFVAAILPLFL